MTPAKRSNANMISATSSKIHAHSVPKIVQPIENFSPRMKDFEKLT